MPFKKGIKTLIIRGIKILHGNIVKYRNIHAASLFEGTALMSHKGCGMLLSFHMLAIRGHDTQHSQFKEEV